MACTSTKLYWDARFLMCQMPSNRRPLEEQEREEEEVKLLSPNHILHFYQKKKSYTLFSMLKQEFSLKLWGPVL
jgi:hypothetical protein